MSKLIDAIDSHPCGTDVPAFRPGDTVKVHVKVVEGNRSRIQVFAGVVISRSGDGLREAFTVRKVSFGVGVERTFPVHSPIIDKIEVDRRGDVRRAKLYYLRGLRGKAAKIKEKRDALIRLGWSRRLTPGLKGRHGERPRCSTRPPQPGNPEPPGDPDNDPSILPAKDQSSVSTPGPSSRSCWPSSSAPSSWRRCCGPSSGRCS